MSKLNDLTGKKFGNWQVMFRNGSTSNKASVWRCKCELCGVEKDIVGYSLTQGKTTKCRKCSAKISHHRKYSNDPLFKSIWNGMKQRCYNKKQEYYKNYGGKGITICDEWLSNPESFCDWAYENGYSKGMSIERIDINGNYEPSNCTFIPKSNQQRNKSNSIIIQIGDTRKCLQEWCDILNLERNKVRWQHDKGYDWHEAFLICLSKKLQN